MPQIRQHIVIDAPADEVWAVLGERFGEVALWAGGVHASRMIAPDVRACETILGTLHERLLAFDPHARCLEYEAARAPRWFRHATNRWCVGDLGAGRSRVDLHAKIVVKPIYGHLMMLVLTPRMRALSFSLANLKHYVETGELHPRKADARADRAPGAKARSVVASPEDVA